MLTEYYTRARKAGLVLSEFEGPDTLEDAYDIQAGASKNVGKIAGWKLGGTTRASRKVFSTNDTYCGPIYKGGVMPSATSLSLPAHIHNVVGEAEVSFRLSDKVANLSGAYVGSDNISDFIASVMPSIELPWSVFPLPQAGLNVLVADSCASGALIYGQESAWSPSLQKSLSGAVTISSNKDVLASGRIEDIVDTPVSALIDFLNLAKVHNMTVRPNQIVATGGATPCVKLPKNQSIDVNFAALGQFSFFY